MFRRSKDKGDSRNQYIQRPKIDTIVVIGNGFDRWQGLDTDYGKFREYYLAHRDEILKKLHLRKHRFTDWDGQEIECSDVELIYGDPFEPGELEEEFWNTFEASLDQVDTERLNAFFGKDRAGLKKLSRCIKNAGRILQEAFCSWIATVNIEERDAGYEFGDNCVFINFNYTDTLLKKFSINPEYEYHIHGEAADKESIIFGHSSHPQEPQYELAKLGGRFSGLYYVDRMLYETDKHCQDNIQLLCMFLGMHAVMCEEIKDIYVLGHSMGPADIAYFDFLVRSTKMQENDADADRNEMMEFDPVEDMFSRLQYVVETVGYQRDDVKQEYTDAMIRKMVEEQDARNKMFQKEFLKHFSGVSEEELLREAEKIKPRTADARWHISYFSEKDKAWIECVMKELGCKNYELLHGIDQCLAGFRK